MKELIVKGLCSDIDEWPDSWQGFPEDVLYGEELLKEMKLFIEYLIDQGLKPKTIKSHIDNLWLMGGELIRKINEDESLRQKTPLDLILENIDEDGGSYCRHLDSEYEMRSYDATCRKFHQFLCIDRARRNCGSK